MRIKVITIVNGTFRTVPKCLEKGSEELKFTGRFEPIQTITLMRCTANTQMQTLTKEEKKKNHVWKENYIAFSQEPSLEDCQVRNRESKRLIDKYPDKQYHGVKRFNIRRSKISPWKNRSPLEDHRQEIKTRVGTQTWIADKKTTTSSKNTKTEL